MNDEHNIVQTMNFMLSCNESKIPCKSIQAFQREAEQEYIEEGGLNGYVHIRPKPASKPSTLQIERYITADFKDYLPCGHQLPADLILEVGKNESSGQAPFCRFKFRGCTVTEKKYGGADAEKGALLVETTTITYEELEVGG